MPPKMEGRIWMGNTVTGIRHDLRKNHEKHRDLHNLALHARSEDGMCAVVGSGAGELRGAMPASMGLEATVAKIKAGQIDPKRLAVIRAILSATQENYIHKLRGATGNAVYLHPDGHREAVYVPDQQLVSDGINDGPYNYFDPTSDALRHFFFDIHPGFSMGTLQRIPRLPKNDCRRIWRILTWGSCGHRRQGAFLLSRSAV